MNSLVRNGILPRPSRTIRFLWPAEIEGSIIYLSQHDDVDRIKANIHMDMVGGGPVTKSVFRISGGPISVPSFISDLGHEVGHFVNEQTEAFASGDAADFPLNAPEGGKEPLLAMMEGLDMGSDHDVFFEGTWAKPGLYLHDWPDRYIHTNYDLAANIDPTKLKRAAFIGAVNAWFLANMSDEDVPAVLAMLERNALTRSGELLERRARLTPADQAAVTQDPLSRSNDARCTALSHSQRSKNQTMKPPLISLQSLKRWSPCLTSPVSRETQRSTRETRTCRGRWARLAIPI